uniref:Uncharacterized protein n=1 Tax=Setaria viridis TaxID=4556 RepID=A0A4U6SVT0_SETVI|nr:hypothetical protein SEVIR_9G170250v2 [Setaria viridis]
MGHMDLFFLASFGALFGGRISATDDSAVCVASHAKYYTGANKGHPTPIRRLTNPQ